MLPDPEAVHVPPPAPTQVHVTPVSDAGKVSATVAPTALLGPLVAAMIVYVSDTPGTAVTLPSVFVMLRSNWEAPALGTLAAMTTSAAAANKPAARVRTCRVGRRAVIEPSGRPRRVCASAETLPHHRLV